MSDTIDMYPASWFQKKRRYLLSYVALTALWFCSVEYRWFCQVETNKGVVSTLDASMKVDKALFDRVMALERDQEHAYRMLMINQERIDGVVSSQLKVTPPTIQEIVPGPSLELKVKKR